jgi:uncharacterized protein YkwD
MLKYLNEIRTSNNLYELKQDKNIDTLSQKYSKYLYDNNMDKTIEYEDHFNKE